MLLMTVEEIIDEATRNAIDLDLRVIKSKDNGEEVVAEDVKLRSQEIKEELEKAKWMDTIAFVPQKSIEWLRLRQTKVTASELGQMVNEGKFGTREQLIQQKSKPIDENAKTEPLPYWNAMEFGNRYEDMSERCYRQRTGVTVKGYGLIPHRTNPRFGASPDGLAIETGVLLELKSPKSRAVEDTGIIPQYYYQIQGQLEACGGLKYCDFVECKIEETQNSSEYLENVSKDSRQDHGAVIKRIGSSKYEYSPEYMKPGEVYEWANVDLDVDMTFYWRLKTIRIIRVKRDKETWERLEKEIGPFWEEVLNTHKQKIEMNIIL